MSIIPDTIIHFDLSRQKSIQAVEQAMMGEERILLITQINPEAEDPDYDALYHIGTIATIKQITKLPNHIIRVMVEGHGRARLLSLSLEETAYMEALVVALSPVTDTMMPMEEEAMIRETKELFIQY
ncbi:MAG: LON peptidase substrate-binding domain-containing protein, partial [Lachnospiraceae bacterium]